MEPVGTLASELVVLSSRAALQLEYAERRDGAIRAWNVVLICAEYSDRRPLGSHVDGVKCVGRCRPTIRVQSLNDCSLKPSHYIYIRHSLCYPSPRRHLKIRFPARLLLAAAVAADIAVLR